MVRLAWLIAGSICIWGATLSAQAATPCVLKAGNLLQNATFAQRREHGGIYHWSSTQHSGEPSFDLKIEDGEARIEKTGTQPWFYFRQRLDVTPIAGEIVALNVEMQLDLRVPEQGQGFKVGGGVKMVARSAANKGRKLLLRSVLDHEPHIGEHDWQHYQIVIKLPEHSSALDVGFLMQADGLLQVRNPVLQLVDRSAGECELSPNAVLGVPQPVSGLR
ncbi:MAG: hypothetical protein AAGF57_13580 [Pseudomonadota bacterium]